MPKWLYTKYTGMLRVYLHAQMALYKEQMLRDHLHAKMALYKVHMLRAHHHAQIALYKVHWHAKISPPCPNGSIQRTDAKRSPPCPNASIQSTHAKISPPCPNGSIQSTHAKRSPPCMPKWLYTKYTCMLRDQLHAEMAQHTGFIIPRDYTSCIQS